MDHLQNTDDEMGSWIPLAAKIKDVVAFLAQRREAAAGSCEEFPAAALERDREMSAVIPSSQNCQSVAAQPAHMQQRLPPE